MDLTIGIILVFLTGASLSMALLFFVGKRSRRASLDQLAAEAVATRDETTEWVASLVRGFGQLMEQSTTAVGFVVVSLDQGFASCNRAAARLLGWPLDWPDQPPQPVQMLDVLQKRFPDLTDGSEILSVSDHDTAIWLEVNRLWLDSVLILSLHDITVQVAARQQALYEQRHDVQTGVLNHRTFLELLGELFKEKERLGHACVALFEINSLKDMNNQLGFSTVTAYLRQFAEHILNAMPSQAIFSRHASNEFFGFFYGYPDAQTLRQAINRLWDDLSALTVESETGERLSLGVTGGLSWYPRDGEHYQELLDYAKFAAYIDKRNGQKGLLSFDRENYLQNGYLLKGREALAELIERNLVRYAFQPVIDVTKGKVFGYEMLMRPQSTVIRSPVDVINLARVQGKLQHVEKMTWFSGMQTYADAVSKGLLAYDAKVFINSIGGVVLADQELERFQETFYDLIKNLVIEITETDQDDESTIRIKRQMARLWRAQIAIDDFGSGYNSELSLLFFQPDIVKVDRAIVQGVDSDPDRQVILKNLITYARQRQIRVLAEGIETREELQEVIACGVDYVQGYYLGRPDFVPRGLTDRQVLEIGEYRYGRRAEVLGN
ncbi:MAG: bifunctional diguanylate cyclase/phosphodiesterase [Clostridia bacterium]|nr:bifunctional diguanylate cyclase/phosphodiesterase [Clostridia bacterium]NCC75284.1 bifunctional diguanylate cyclase/phosphodiesterase [Clostridia bacterium]